MYSNTKVRIKKLGKNGKLNDKKKYILYYEKRSNHTIDNLKLVQPKTTLIKMNPTYNFNYRETLEMKDPNGPKKSLVIHKSFSIDGQEVCSNTLSDRILPKRTLPKNQIVSSYMEKSLKTKKLYPFYAPKTDQIYKFKTFNSNKSYASKMPYLKQGRTISVEKNNRIFNRQNTYSNGNLNNIRKKTFPNSADKYDQKSQPYFNQNVIDLDNCKYLETVNILYPHLINTVVHHRRRKNKNQAFEKNKTYDYNLNKKMAGFQKIELQRPQVIKKKPNDALRKKMINLKKSTYTKKLLDSKTEQNGTFYKMKNNRNLTHKIIPKFKNKRYEVLYESTDKIRENIKRPSIEDGFHGQQILFCPLHGYFFKKEF